MEAGEETYYFESLPKYEDELVKKHFGEQSLHRDLVRIKMKDTGCHLQTVTQRFMDHHHILTNIKLRKDDVWIVTFPKCGTTWTQELVWNIVNGVQVSRIPEPLFERSPFIDIPMIAQNVDVEEFYSKLENMPSPRVIKTHYPFELLPPGLLDTCKVIFVCRNVKDACVSYYHHLLSAKMTFLEATFPEFAGDLYMRNNLLQGGYFEMLRSGWTRRNNPNMLMLWYEEMKEDQRACVQRMMAHIGYTLTEDKVTELCEAMTFSNYRKISSLNHIQSFDASKGEFTRKGVVGDWVNHFPQDLNHRWNGWIEENLDNIGITDEKVIAYFDLNYSK